MSEITDSDGSTDGIVSPPGTIHEFHDVGGADALSYTVVTAVAAARDTDPVALPPLYDSVDVDALDQLVHGARDRPQSVDGYVSFTYAGYEVTVDFDGWIRLTLATDEERPSR